MKKLCLLCFLFMVFIFAQGQESTFGKGIINVGGEEEGWSLKMGAQLQFQGSHSWKEEPQESYTSGTEFLIRRARIKFDGFVLTPRLKYKLAIGLSNRDISGASPYTSNAPRYILDAVIKWNFYKNFELWFGQTKLPGNRETMISSGNLQFVDRSALSNSHALDRDLGLQLRHKFNVSEQFVITEALAISQGEGRNITSGNLGGYEYTARVELFPLGEFAQDGAYLGGDLVREEKPKLALGLSYDYNDNAVRISGNRGAYLISDEHFYTSDIRSWYVDGMFKYHGLSLMAEYVSRTSSAPVSHQDAPDVAPLAVRTGHGWNGQMGYLFPGNWEVAARYTYLDFGHDVLRQLSQDQFTLGGSKYIVGHKLKVQTDFTYANFEGDRDQVQWRVLFQVHF